MITLYHGSNIKGLNELKPNLADHDRPYVYLTTIDVVAAFYLCNAVERPYYWFPYGFEGGIPVYNELYPNALREASEGVSGCIYRSHFGERGDTVCEYTLRKARDITRFGLGEPACRQCVYAVYGIFALGENEDWAL